MHIATQESHLEPGHARLAGPLTRMQLEEGCHRLLSLPPRLWFQLSRLCQCCQLVARLMGCFCLGPLQPRRGPCWKQDLRAAERAAESEGQTCLCLPGETCHMLPLAAHPAGCNSNAMIP